MGWQPWLELAVRFMVKEGLIIKCVGRPAVRREKYFPPAVFETTTTACAPRSILYPKGHSLARSLACRNPDRDSQDKRQSKGAAYFLPSFPFFGTLIALQQRTARKSLISVTDGGNLCIRISTKRGWWWWWCYAYCVLRISPRGQSADECKWRAIYCIWQN